MQGTVSYAFDTAGMLSLVIGVLLPILVGYFTKKSMNSGLKAAILTGVAGASAVLTQWLDCINNHQHFIWQAALLSAFATWATAEAAYLKWWKPGGVADYVQARGVTDDPGPVWTSDPIEPPPDPDADPSGGVAALSTTTPVDKGVTPLNRSQWNGPEHAA